MNWACDSDDAALMLWTAAVDRFGLTLPPDAWVLELGCAETDWLERMRALNPGMTLTGVDARATEIEGRDGCRVGSGTDPNLEAPESLDAVVLLGALEHFGLGFYGDAVEDDGDTVTMQNIARWLKPGGWVYFDVPANPTYSIRPNRHYRVYAPESVGERLLPDGLVERVRCYSLPEPTAGLWIDGEPQTDLVPYHYVAVVADKRDA
jgi:SAM-dependent methyltransferase